LYKGTGTSTKEGAMAGLNKVEGKLEGVADKVKGAVGK
jgi:hypothetical protein